MNHNRDVVILSAVRTPLGKFLGSLAGIPAGRLGALVIDEAVQRAGLDKERIDDVILGSVLTAGAGMNVARQAAIFAGLPVTTPAQTVNMVCGSGMMSIIHAARAIQTGEADFVVAGGTESMSGSPYILNRAREGFKMGHVQVIDSMIQDGLTDVFENIHMGMIAENIASLYGISRQEQDAFAQSSQEKAIEAIRSGRFVDEIVPVETRQKKEVVRFAQDEYPRADSIAGKPVQTETSLQTGRYGDGREFFRHQRRGSRAGSGGSRQR